MKDRNPIGISAMALNFPEQVRTNDFWVENYPDLVVARATTKLYAGDEEKENLSRWDKAVSRFKDDPFAGAKERRVLRSDESIIDYAAGAVHKVLKAAGLSLNQIGMIMVNSMFPEHVDEGDAAYLAQKLDYNGLCWSLNSTCTGALLGLDMARNCVDTGRYEYVLVVNTCSYSRFMKESSSKSFAIGDGASAFIVSRLKGSQGIIGSKFLNSFRSVGIIHNSMSVTEDGQPLREIVFTKGQGSKVGHLTKTYLQEMLEAFSADYQEEMGQADFYFSFNATGWYSSYFCSELGIPPEKTIDVFPRYGNVSGVSILASLYHAHLEGKIKEDDLLLIYNHGFASNNVMMLMRWGDVRLA